MTSFESKVTRLSDAGQPRFLVEFIGDHGESVAIECAPSSSGDEPSREEIVAEARRLARDVAAREDSTGRETRAPQPTFASGAEGLSRPPEQTEARTHSSDGRDWGTE